VVADELWRVIGQPPAHIWEDTMNILRNAMRIQAIAAAIYGLSYFFIPQLCDRDAV